MSSIVSYPIWNFLSYNNILYDFPSCYIIKCLFQIIFMDLISSQLLYIPINVFTN